MIWVGEKGCDIYTTHGHSQTMSQRNSARIMKTCVKLKSNHVFAGTNSTKIIQQENESVQQCLTKLKLLVKDCGYKTYMV